MEVGRHWGTVRLIACLLTSALLLGGCANRPVNGYFVSNGTPDQIVMVHLVEAPRGHLSGAIVVTTINPSASKLDVSDDSVAGSIAGHNVSLKVLGALSTVASWLGDDNLLVGSLDGGRLTLSKGNQTFVFDQISAGAYQNRVQDLQRVAGHINQTRDAVEALKHAAAYAQKVNLALEQYLAWGQARINKRPEVQAWWNGRIKMYSACLAKVKPLAQVHVAPWQWPPCLLSVEDDAFNRREVVREIQGLVAEQFKQVTSLNHAITEGQSMIRTAGQQLHEACSVAPNPGSCEVFWRNWKAHEGYMIASSGAAAFRALAPRASRAVQSDLGVATSANARLKAISAELQQIRNGTKT